MEKNNPQLIPQLVRSEDDYKARMRVFYSYFWSDVIPKWESKLNAKEDLNNEVILQALQEYAREDWISNGFREEIFDSELKKENLKRYPRNFLKFLIVFVTFVIILLSSALVKTFSGFFMFFGLIGLFFWFVWKAYSSYKGNS